MVPSDKAANNVVVVCRLHYIDTLKQELNGTKAYEETSIDEKSVVYSHSNEILNKFAADVKERQDRLPTMNWLPKLHKIPYKAMFIANSSSCTTTDIAYLPFYRRSAQLNHEVFLLSDYGVMLCTR